MEQGNLPRGGPTQRTTMCDRARAHSVKAAFKSLCVLFLLSVGSGGTLAFQVLPKVSDVDRKLASLGSNWLDPAAQFAMRNALPMVKNPVHEAITLAAMGCTSGPGSEEDCVVLDAVSANRILLYGVRWPDDPPFRLDSKNPPRISKCDTSITLRSTAQPQCWLALFKDAGASAKVALTKKPGNPAFGPGDYLLYRSHYGDLQFFHSMAAYDDEPAALTLTRMRMWARFLWGVAIGEVRTDVPIREIGIEELTPYFPGDMTVTNLFATGIVEVRKDLDKVALGTLLHMVQDSFSWAHAERLDASGGMCADMPRFSKPGKLAQFYSYAQQAGHLHDEKDTFTALRIQNLQFTPTVVEVSRNLVTLWTERANWDEATKYFDCIFDVVDARVLAGPGPFVEN